MIVVVKTHIAGSTNILKLDLNITFSKVIIYNFTIMYKIIFAYLNQLIIESFYGICTRSKVFVM